MYSVELAKKFQLSKKNLHPPTSVQDVVLLAPGADDLPSQTIDHASGRRTIMAEKQIDNMSNEGALPPATGKNETAQVPPDSKTGTDSRQSSTGGASTGGPGGPDSGSDAMPGQSNAL
jgi:hypothetical protein